MTKCQFNTFLKLINGANKIILTLTDHQEISTSATDISINWLIINPDSSNPKKIFWSQIQMIVFEYPNQKSVSLTF